MIEILWLHLLLVSFTMIKVIKVWDDDRHWQSNRQDTSNGTQGTYNLTPYTHRPNSKEQVKIKKTELLVQLIIIIIISIIRIVDR